MHNYFIIITKVTLNGKKEYSKVTKTSEVKCTFHNINHKRSPLGYGAPTNAAELSAITLSAL